MEFESYSRALNAQLTYLFSFARKINEIDTFAALFLESRGAQDPGWNTTATAFEVFSEMQELAFKGVPLSKSEVRQLLCLYAQLAEAGGVYEGLLNTMQVAQLKPYSQWPFHDLVRVRQRNRAVIGPNANAMFRRLAEVATSIGMSGLAGLLEITFRDDIRNGIAHADYILANEGLRLRRRNGGQAQLVAYADIVNAVQISLFFFDFLHACRQRVAESFRPARTIVGRFSSSPPMPYTVELREDGGLGISTDAPGVQVDDAYVRQQRINNRLGGQVVAAYIAPGMNVPPALLEEISSMGFEVLVVDFENEDKFSALIAEVTEHGLWDAAEHAENAESALLMATPFGFRKISTAAEFGLWLPPVEEVALSEPFGSTTG